MLEVKVEELNGRFQLDTPMFAERAGVKAYFEACVKAYKDSAPGAEIRLQVVDRCDLVRTNQVQVIFEEDGKPRKVITPVLLVSDDVSANSIMQMFAEVIG